MQVFKGKNIVMNVWKEDQFNFIGNNKFFILIEFENQSSG